MNLPCTGLINALINNTVKAKIWWLDRINFDIFSELIVVIISIVTRLQWLES